MFFGEIISQEKSFLFKENSKENNTREVLEISNAVLSPTSKESGSLYVRIKER
jgi:hypothetical protein